MVGVSSTTTAARRLCRVRAPRRRARSCEELRSWCRERMRDYEYPHLMRFVDELPRTLSGKLQRFKLRTLAAEAAER